LLEAKEGRCFACGPNNPIGLKLAFRVDGDDYVTEFTPRPEHQGWDDIVHGGLIATVLDECMARMLWERGLLFATAELTVRYKSPLRVGTTMTVRARTVRESDRLVEAEAEGVDDSGTAIALARARLLRVRE
jgi:uncharacterized protein (TIGR00369 family)